MLGMNFPLETGWIHRLPMITEEQKAEFERMTEVIREAKAKHEEWRAKHHDKLRSEVIYTWPDPEIKGEWQVSSIKPKWWFA